MRGGNAAWTSETVRARLVTAALLVAIATTACSGGASTSTPPGPSGSLLPTTPTALPQFDPQRFRELLAQLHGRPVVVNVWASWCGPCVVEAPDMAAAGREFQGLVQFLGVDVLDQLGPARAFIRKYGWNFPSVFDPTAAIRNDLGFIGQPVTLVLDGSGKRVFTQSGAITLDVLRKELTPLG